MKTPPSAHFTPLPLGAAFNARREALPASLRLADSAHHGFGRQVYRGIPFDLGQPEADNVLLLDQAPVSLAVDDLCATYLVFLHQAEDYPAYDQGELAHAGRTGNELGHRVSDYALEYLDGSLSEFPILRRFAIQQSHIRWGASPFAAVEALNPVVFSSTGESMSLGQMPAVTFGYGETRHRSGRDDFSAEHLWLYALPNPTPDKPIRRIILTPRHERSAIYGLTSTQLPAHPLQPGLRQKLLLDLPDGVSLNALGDLEAIGLDLGSVIAAYGALDYDPAQWHGPNANAQPVRSPRSVIVEYAAHPAARLYVGTDGSAASYDLAQAAGALGLGITLTSVEQGVLNPVGVNCIRAFAGRGIRVWGARTLSSDPSWRYLNVRRLFNYVEKSIENGTQWMVFEPNDYDLWARAKRNISAFLKTVWMQGALFGQSTDEAFYVKCDAENNPIETRDAGQLIIDIGIAPVKPAEFVIIHISQYAPES